MSMKRRAAVAVLAALLGAANLAQAQDQRFDDWRVGVDGTAAGAYAATVNESGAVLGQACGPDGHCEYRMLSTLRCEPDAIYPGIANSDLGSFSLDLICRAGGEDGSHLLAIGPFETIDRIARGAARVGIAIPLDGNDFQVVRFSLVGATAAVTTMRDAVERGLSSASRPVGARRQTTL
jgi:hypothetical protein